MRTLEEKALELLKHPEQYPGLPPRNRKDRCFLIWEHPSFLPVISWALSKVEDSFYVRRITWRLSTDPSHDFVEPDTFGADASISQSTALELMDALTALEFKPFYRDENLGLDGVRYGVSVECFRINCELIWWCEPPPALKQMAEWFQKVRTAFEQVLPRVGE